MTAGEQDGAPVATTRDARAAMKRVRALPSGGLRARGSIKVNRPGEPLVSVVLPVLNGGAPFVAAMDSVLTQRYENVELIVVDGGSTDGTLALLERNDRRIDVWISERDDGVYQAMKLGPEMDTLIANGVAAETIVVVPNGKNAYLGSFYTNSPVTGNWEDYIYRDVVNYIDGRYRTMARASSRGIAGHSMGGYGAFTIAMKHPDVFGATYALSPCCLGMEGDIGPENPVWGKAAKITSRDLFTRMPQSFDDFFTVAMVAISSAFSPNKQRPPLYVDFPFVEKKGVRVRNEPAYSSYRSKMPLYQVEQYRDNLMKLRGIALDVGEFDEFSHIRSTTAMLSAELSQREIPHAFEIYRGGDHGNKIRERFKTEVMPFFKEVLEK